MIKEVVVVEGKSDIQRVQQALAVECIQTEGYTLRKAVLEKIRIAYEKRGIIILTDPDSAGERIRRFLTKRFPNAKHAFIPLEDAYDHNDIGIEQASVEAIRKAFEQVHTESLVSSNLFSMVDLLRGELIGSPSSSKRRAHMGRILGLGYANGKQFLYRLNHYGIQKNDFDAALALLQDK